MTQAVVYIVRNNIVRNNECAFSEMALPYNGHNNPVLTASQETVVASQETVVAGDTGINTCDRLLARRPGINVAIMLPRISCRGLGVLPRIRSAAAD